MSNGLYVAVTWTKSSLDYIQNLINMYRIDNGLSRDKIHTTLIYSRKFAVVGLEEFVVKPYARIIGYDKWVGKDGKAALVATLDSAYLSGRHQYLMRNFNLTYDYPDYQPHITLSYNISPDMDISKLPVGALLIIDEEYQEELIDNWQNS